MGKKVIFALNRIMQPSLSLPDFIRLAAECSASGIEIRNDLPDPSLLGAESPESIRSLCDDLGVGILSVNALQRFNDPALLKEKEAELQALAEEALAAGCRQIVLCPVNDPENPLNKSETMDNLIIALQTYGRILKDTDMTALIEPLGFESCSLRSKAQAVRGIGECGYPERFGLVHDTFHHYLSGEKVFFPQETGLVHVSGVIDRKAVHEMTDDDRLMLDKRDLMDNKGQVEALYSGGYSGGVSFEPFSPEIQNLPPHEIKKRVRSSLEYLFE